MRWFYADRVPDTSRVDTLPITVSLPCPMRTYAIATDALCMPLDSKVTTRADEPQ